MFQEKECVAKAKSCQNLGYFRNDEKVPEATPWGV